MSADLYWIDGPWRGRLAIASRPRGGDWLTGEVKAWRAGGIDEVVSFLTSDEVRDLGLDEEAALCHASGMAFVSFPIADRSVPVSRSKAGDLVKGLEGELAKGKAVALHCRQGIGRSALIAASLLVLAGLEPEAAFSRLTRDRGTPVPETAEQRDWVARLAQEVAPARL